MRVLVREIEVPTIDCSLIVMAGIVMAGLVPAIHVFVARKAWMPATSAGMTK
jgi:hypothetical protein